MNRPHSAHGWLSPVEFVEQWLNRQQLQLARTVNTSDSGRKDEVHSSASRSSSEWFSPLQSILHPLQAPRSQSSQL